MILADWARDRTDLPLVWPHGLVRPKTRQNVRTPELINSIQLFNGGQRWQVVVVLWDDEHHDNPISGEYLLQSAK